MMKKEARPVRYGPGAIIADVNQLKHLSLFVYDRFLFSLAMCASEVNLSASRT